MPTGVDLFLHQQGLDTSTPSGRVMFQMLGVFAEFERAASFASASTPAARPGEGDEARASSVKPAVEARIRELRAEGMGSLKIGRPIGVGTSVVLRVLITA
jgi:DNA invertase Pin-like site-specific DNA recombinase